MITRVAKGTASSKTSSTTLTLSNVAVDAGALLVVGIAYEDTAGNPTSVKWGNRVLKETRKRHDATNGITVALWRAKTKKARTKDIVVGWESAITKKVLFATQLTEVSKEDVGNGALSASTSNPNTGAIVTTTIADTFHIAAFASEGPANDDLGVATLGHTLGHTLGQRVGTNGVPPVSNITIQETYDILSLTGDCRSRMTGATSRNWVNVIAAYAASRTYTILSVGRSGKLNDTDSDVIVVVTDSSTEDAPDNIFEIRIDPDTFDSMSDAETDDFIRAECAWHLTHRIEGDPLESPQVSASQQTKMDNLVNDTFDV